jgi:hypothetical protein
MLDAVGLAREVQEPAVVDDPVDDRGGWFAPGLTWIHRCDFGVAAWEKEKYPSELG